MDEAEEAGRKISYSAAVHQAAGLLGEGRLKILSLDVPDNQEDRDEFTAPAGVDPERHRLDLRAKELQNEAEAAGLALTYSEAVHRAAEEDPLPVTLTAPTSRVEMFDDLFDIEHRDELDAVARTLSVKLGVDYLDAIGTIQKWAGSLWSHDEPLTLARVLEHGGITRAELDADARRLGITADPAVVTLAAGGEQEEELDAAGRVKLSENIDVAELIHDDVERSRAYLAYHAIDWQPGAVTTLSHGLSRDEFEERWREFAEAGVDLVATLQREQRLVAECHKRTLDVRRQQRREDDERAKNAKRRSAS